VLEDIYGIASSLTRRRILLSLAQCEKGFSDLMRSVAMDPEHDTGPFLYHIHRLETLALLSSKDARYSLTARGEEICRHLMLITQAIEPEGPDLGPAEPHVGSASHNPHVRARQPQPSTGGTSGNMKPQRAEPIIRLLEERDVKDILEVLSQEEFYSRQLAHIKEHLTRVARRGRDRYETNMVAQVEGRAIARMVVDTNYPPYAELAGLMVHPSWQGEGIGTKLISRFTGLARERGCPIQYVIVDATNWRAQKLYAENGFHPALLKGFHEKGLEISMFRFDEGTVPREFLDRHPLAQLSVCEGEAGGSVGSSEMRWTDPLNGASLVLNVRGRRHLAMPRIAGVALSIGQIAVRARVEEHAERIAPGKSVAFSILVENGGKCAVSLGLACILPEGADLAGNDWPMRLDLPAGASRQLDLAVSLKRKFDVPALSFTTVLATCQIAAQESGLRSPIVVSAGFERD